ncbi:MAG TPA: glycosyltransferase [Candidatus Cybelea sp.]|nr:glycosyltransferase [Candidatus Cybelea sp.]
MSVLQVRPGPALPAIAPLARTTAHGKFLFAGNEKLYVRGTTYGTFRLDELGNERHHPGRVDRDFELMAANGFNAVRTYTVPPLWLLDAAEHHGLRVMVGLPWEQHVAFLDDHSRAKEIERRVREYAAKCAGHPSILCYAVGNEIPSSVVRWLGAQRVEHFIERLYGAVKTEDPGALVTYVNYPTTEYLQLPFLDLVAFNVYLERKQQLGAYLSRLQNIAGDRPLVMAEVGLDSRRNGERSQAESLSWQLRTIFESGCAGAFTFAWTDEWFRGGHPIADWDFGLTRRGRSPKPALAAVREGFAEVPFRAHMKWPRISVIVCAYNAQATIRECLDGLARVDYPNFEVIVVNDGSTDGTRAIAAEYAVRLINTPNRGLSNARNTGLEAATGEIVAYLDSDAYPDQDWLKYLGHAFLDSTHSGVGGPNIAPPNLGTVADCFDNAPGGPTHVLLSDREAEHIPGCNMAFRREALAAIGGFDPSLRVAGDDVDVCWRLSERGGTLGFAPAAVVWHHRRTTLRSYLKQQRGYGRAEALLEKKWPEKYNAAGHATWGGRIYARGITPALSFWRSRIYQGPWGSAPYQSLERPEPTLFSSLPLMPEWYLVIAALAALCALGVLWPPLLLALPLLAAAVLAPVVQAAKAARQAVFETRPRTKLQAIRSRALVGFLHLAQPFARLAGRMEYGLTAWRSPLTPRIWLVKPRSDTVWSESWHAPDTWLTTLEKALRANDGVTLRGGAYDRWDLEVRGGMLGCARSLLLVEEHGAGRQLARLRSRPHFSTASIIAVAALFALAAAAGFTGAWAACGIFAALAAGVAVRATDECATAMERVARATGGLREVSHR